MHLESLFIEFKCDPTTIRRYARLRLKDNPNDPDADLLLTLIKATDDTLMRTGEILFESLFTAVNESAHDTIEDSVNEALAEGALGIKYRS